MELVVDSHGDNVVLLGRVAMEENCFAKLWNGCNKFINFETNNRNNFITRLRTNVQAYGPCSKRTTKLRYNDKFGGKSPNQITMATKFTANHLRKLSFVCISTVQLHRMLKSSTFTHSATNIRMWQRWSVATERISYHICLSPRCIIK